jgi:hypothetical protein
MIYEIFSRPRTAHERIKAAYSDTRPRDPPRSLSVLRVQVPLTGVDDKACEFVGKRNSAFIPIHSYTATIGLEQRL